MARTDDTNRFYNRATLDQALEQLDQLVPDLSRSEYDVRQRKPRKASPAWVHDDAGSRAGVQVMILATHLIDRYATNKVLSHTARVETKEDPYFDEDQLGNAGIKETPKEFKKAIAPLAHSRSKGASKYKPERDRFAFAYFACNAKKRLDDNLKRQHDKAQTLTEALALYDTIVSERCASSRAIFSYIEKTWLEGLAYIPPIVEDTDPDVKKLAEPRLSHHFIPQKLEDYLPPNGRFGDTFNPGELTYIADRIISQFENAEERLALVSGKVNAGKSGCIVELLRRLPREDETIGWIFEAPDATASKFLPVFTVSVQDHSGFELLLMVLAFLERLNLAPKERRKFDFDKRLKELPLEFGQELEIGAVEAIKSRIAELHENTPAIFILTNWEDLTWSTPRAQLRDQSKASLIKLLHDSSDVSRFVITTTTTPNSRAHQALPEKFQYTVKDPRFLHIDRYFRGLEFPTCYKKDLFATGHRMDDAAIPGDHLILIATTLELCRGATAWERRAIKALRDLTPEHYRSEVAAPPHQFVKLLVERLEDRNLFRIVMAITASEDGLRLSSLHRLLSEWDRDAGRQLQRVGAEIKDGLTEVEKLANSFFLRQRMINPISLTQFSPVDRDMASEPSWEIYETLRQTILTALTDPGQQGWARPYNQLLREATRHVAKLAFKRAQEWRARTMFANLTPWWQDLLLDIQAYEALLASIDPADLAIRSVNAEQIHENPLLHHASERIFTCGKSHAAAVAVKFAVQTLLIDIVDHDNRMSMCYDQDLMRMRLYMLPFRGVGERHFERLDDKSSDLPKTIPDWMNGIFTQEELIRLLEAIAISALHAQTPKVVRWAWNRTEEVIADAVAAGGDRRALLARAVRTHCSTIDMAVQLGKPLLKDRFDEDVAGHRRTLNQLDRFLIDEFASAAALTATPAVQASSLTMDHDTVEAVGRIRVRRAQLLGLLGDLKGAEVEFANIHSWDTMMARFRGDGKATILEGRPARVALQLLMRSEMLLQHDSLNHAKILGRIGGMLSINAARLARFGGAEQAAMLVDRSRFAFLTGDHELAVHYAFEARQFCDDNRVSYGMQIQILLNHVAILIDCSDSARGSGHLDMFGNIATLEDAEGDVDAVYQTAEALSLKPTEGVALYLKVRLQQIRSDLHAPAEQGWLETAREEITAAIDIMNECGDMSYRDSMEKLRYTLPAAPALSS